MRPIVSKVGLLAVGIGVGAIASRTTLLLPQKHSSRAVPIQAEGLASAFHDVALRTPPPNAQVARERPDSLATAISRAQQFTNRLERAKALQRLVAQLSQTDPQAAARLALSLSTRGGRGTTSLVWWVEPGAVLIQPRRWPGSRAFPRAAAVARPCNKSSPRGRRWTQAEPPAL